MKFLTKEIFFPVISVCVITTFSILLYADFNKKIDAGNLKQIGIISFKREVAQRKYQSQVVWEGIEQNHPVYNNDSIRTSDLSEAVIHLPDGTDISIEENSMIMLSSLENAININFEQGSISANRTGVKGTDIASINIKSQDATVSIDKSSIQLTQLDNKELDLTVSDGTAKVKSGTEETIIKTNEKALISVDRKETQIVQLKFDLKEPVSNRYFITEDLKQDVLFTWELFGNFKDTTLEISKDRSFEKILTSQKNLPVNTIKIGLESGLYFWRISAINDDKKQIEISETGKFNIIYRKPVKLISPQPNEIIKHSASQNSVSFRWSEDTLASAYTIEVSQNKDFTTLLKNINTSLKNITIDDLNKGEYFWRVNSNISIGSEQIVKTGLISSFIIDRIKNINPHVLIRPVNGEKIDAAIVKSKGLILSWNNDPSFSSFEVEIARDKDFKNQIFEQKRRVNFTEIKQEMPAGKYFWHVEGMVNSGEVIPYSNVGEFEIVISETLKLIAPAENSEIKISSKLKKKEIQFSWKKTELKGNYKLEISKQEDFSESKTINFKNRSSGSAPFTESGEYYWRVILTDDQNREIVKSESSKLVISIDEFVPEIKTYLIVKSPIKGGKIYIDSKYKGKSEFKMLIRPDVNIAVKIIASGYSDFTQQLKVKEGETFTLSPLMGKIRKLQRIKWVCALKTPISSAPVCYQDKIILSSENGSIIILNNSGKVLLSKKITKSFESKLLVYEKNIYAVDVDGVLYSIDLATANVNWKIKAGGPLLFKSEPVISDNKIFLATGFGIVEAYDLKGNKLWNIELDEAIYNSLLIIKNSLIIPTDALKIYSLNSEDGDENWSTPIDGRVITLTPLVHDDIIYFGCYSGTFYAISSNNGRVIWNFKSGGPIYSTPVAVNKSIFFGSENGYIYSLNDKTGALNWQFKSSYPVKSSPIYAFDSIVISNDRTVYSLNPVNGNILWQNTFDSKIKTSPTFAGDTVILGLVNGNIVSVRNNLIELSQ